MSNSPKRVTPAYACDCHIHVFDSRFPVYSGKVPGNHPASEYRLVQQRIDHIGRLPQPEGARHAAFDVIRRLLDMGRAWVKLTSVVYPDSDVESHSKVARAFVEAAPERMLWGSDWPHGIEKEMPDDVELIDRLVQWAPDETTWHRILVENPDILYAFPRTGSA